jgi:hypothetical protein
MEYMMKLGCLNDCGLHAEGRLEISRYADVQCPREDDAYNPLQ